MSPMRSKPWASWELREGLTSSWALWWVPVRGAAGWAGMIRRTRLSILAQWDVLPLMSQPLLVTLIQGPWGLLTAVLGTAWVQGKDLGLCLLCHFHSTASKEHEPCIGTLRGLSVSLSPSVTSYWHQEWLGIEFEEENSFWGESREMFLPLHGDASAQPCLCLRWVAPRSLITEASCVIGATQGRHPLNPLIKYDSDMR